jgi:hypothetical protein
MLQSDFAIITPSYAPDFERCKLLSWSIQQSLSDKVKHYIVVDARDMILFRQLQNRYTEIITVESVLPWWIQRLPFAKNGWFSLSNLFIRNWMLQQIVKLAIAEYITQEVMVFVDSDVSFIRPFDFKNFIHEDKIRLLREPNCDNYQMPRHYKWHQTASQLLGLPNVKYPASGYIGNIITWKRKNVLKLHKHLEDVSGKGWIQTLSSSWHLSEYILYGIFVERILGEDSGHYYNAQKICHEYWNPEEMSKEDLEQFFAEIEPEHIAVMISAKAGISVDRYQKLLSKSPQVLIKA